LNFLEVPIGFSWRQSENKIFFENDYFDKHEVIVLEAFFI